MRYQLDNDSLYFLSIFKLKEANVFHETCEAHLILDARLDHLIDTCAVIWFLGVPVVNYLFNAL